MATGKTPAVPAQNPPMVPRFDPTVETWDHFDSGSDTVSGSDLAKDEMLDALVSVPFGIYRVTFRPGAGGRDFVTCETLIAPADHPRFRLGYVMQGEKKDKKVQINELPFLPGDMIVFNDSSTGIRRQIVQYLAAKEFITIPDGAETGKMGGSRFDAPVDQWTNINHGEMWFNTDGLPNYMADIRLTCPRGIRYSDYENDMAPDGARTRYLA
jgi:hypothetical protein